MNLKPSLSRLYGWTPEPAGYGDIKPNDQVVKLASDKIRDDSTVKY